MYTLIKIKEHSIQKIGEKKKDFWAINTMFVPIPIKKGDLDIYSEKSINKTMDDLTKRSSPQQITCRLASTSSFNETGTSDYGSVTSGTSRKSHGKTRNISSGKDTWNCSKKECMLCFAVVGSKRKEQIQNNQKTTSGSEKEKR